MTQWCPFSDFAFPLFEKCFDTLKIFFSMLSKFTTNNLILFCKQSRMKLFVNKTAYDKIKIQ